MIDFLVVLMKSLQDLLERLDSFWRLKRLELKADYVVETSIHTTILFCAKSAKMLMIYINGIRFGAQAFISARFRMRNLALMKATGPKRLPFI